MSQEQLNDPKMQGQPPPYSPQPTNAAPVTVMQPSAQVMYHTNIIPVVVGQQMGPKPSTMTCSSCGLDIVTRVETKPTLRTHLFAALLCLIGCWPCVCVPYCVDSCNNANHYCPNCSAYIGTHIN